MKTVIGLLSVLAGLAAQTPAPAPKPTQFRTAPAAGPAAASSEIDGVIQMLKSGASEDLVVKTLQMAGKSYKLAPADMLKLLQAKVPERVIQTMLDPKAAPAAAPAPAPAPVAAAAPAAKVAPVAAGPVAITDRMPDTPHPPAVEKQAAGPKKRRLAVTAFDYSAVKNWVTFWFQNDVNIGQGIRAMMTVRMAKLGTITLLEREKVDNLIKEQDMGAGNRVAQGTKARIGKIKGADAILFGDIVIFGRDDVKKKTGFLGTLGRQAAGGWAQINKEEKAVVGINFRIVDAETGEVIETGESRGESSRKSKNWGAVIGTNKGGGGVGSDMMSSNFEETIIGEATSDAVNKLIAQLNERIPKLPEKDLGIEGRVASVQPNNTVYLTVGTNDGVEVGDRFEVLQINGEVKDPQTGDVLDIQFEKVGEFVATQVRDRTTIGNYGGQGLSPTYAGMAGKGYAARKMKGN